MEYLSAPVEVSLEVTNTCNLTCVHCYSSSGPFRLPDELRLDELFSLVDQLVAMQVFRLQLVGGEPFARRDTLELVKYAKTKRMAVTCSTNGAFFDEATVRRLTEYGLDNVQVSLDGASPETHDRIRGRKGSHAAAVTAIRRSKESGLAVTIGCTVMRANVDEIPSLGDLALALQVDALHVMGLQPGGRGIGIFEREAISDDQWLAISNYFAGNFEEFRLRLAVSVQGGRFAHINRGLMDSARLGELDELDKMFVNCDCARGRCVIDSRGNVFPCDMYRTADMNIRATPFSEIWHNSKVLQAFRRRNVRDISSCSTCEFADWCRGGCASTAFNVTGHLNHRDPRCRLASPDAVRA